MILFPMFVIYRRLGYVAKHNAHIYGSNGEAVIYKNTTLLRSVL